MHKGSFSRIGYVIALSVLVNHTGVCSFQLFFYTFYTQNEMLKEETEWK